MNDLSRSLLSLAGFDPTGGAGVLQDSAAFRAYGWHPLAVPTSTVAEDSVHVLTAVDTPFSVLAGSLRLLADDFDIAGVKLGLLGKDPEAIPLLARFLRDLKQRRRIPVVYDPVLRNSRGDLMGDEGMLGLIQRELLPHVDLLTPNLREARLWLGNDGLGAEAAAKLFVERFQTPVLVTGVETAPQESGETVQVEDLLCDLQGVQRYRGPRIDADPHGTGCLHSSLLLIALASGKTLAQAAWWAKGEMQKNFTQLYQPAKSRRPFLPIRLV